jgi:hypothetical protein
MEISNQFIGWGLLIASGLLTLWRKKKSFDNPRHSNYWKHLFEKSMDGFCGFFALVSLIGGVILVALDYQDSWGGLVLLPVYGFMIFLLIGIA